jgi:hypothetical protein
MRILMTASDERGGARARTVLEDAGHEVLACVGPAGEPFPCRGVAGETCPLDAGASVAVSCPGSVPPEPSAGEVGLVCALRHQLPVLVAAPADVSWPGSRFGLVPLDDLPAAVEAAAAAVLSKHTQAVLAEARRVAGDGAAAAVRRVGTGLVVVLDLPEDLDEHAAEALAVRVLAIARQVDPWASSVDVRRGAV